MKDLQNNYYNRHFSHIYVEKAVTGHPRTAEILKKLPGAGVIEINHYKDVFCRRGQSFLKQSKSRNLIIAAKQGNLIYEGAKVCQSFGNSYFYYTSCVMNCLYDCEYCYLKGMYPSGNIVIFVNIEDIFEETKKLLLQHPVYLCVSYDTDLMALEPLTGYVMEWVDFVRTQKNLTVEIRTKCANEALIDKLELCDNVIYAFTMSPQTVTDAYEHRTPPLALRLACAKKAAQKGMKVRLCFDPMIYCKNWESAYTQMLKEIFSVISAEELVDVSVGSFRISQDYLKKMRKDNPNSCVVQFPFENDGGVYHYPLALMNEMEHFFKAELLNYIGSEKIFSWNDSSK